MRQWEDGELIYVENDIALMVYVETDDPSKVGTSGWYLPGGEAEEIWVEFIGRRTRV